MRQVRRGIMEADEIASPNSSRLEKRPRLLIIFTSSVSVAFYFGLYGYLREGGFDVSVISSQGSALNLATQEGVSAIAVAMRREISLGHDLVSLWRLWRAIRKIRPDITNVGTPKAGLVGGLAALMAGVPHRIYTLHGLRLETTVGWKRRLLTNAERLACYCAHRVHCVSPSLRKRAIELGLVGPDKAVVVGPGTCAGVDTARFHATRDARHNALVLRRKFGIGEDAPVIGFVGRFTRDKGVAELYRAFARLRERHSNLRLLLVGDFEAGDPVREDIRQAIESDHTVIRTGFISDVSPFYHLMDVCVLPTYREGFGVVPLEAQAAGIPVVTTQATGAVESVLDKQTGFIVPVSDVDALSAAIDSLLSDSALRKRMGQAGCAWVNSVFRREIVWAAHLEFYKRLRLSAGAPSPKLKSWPRNVFSGMGIAKGPQMPPLQSGWRLWIKKLFDRSAALCGMVVLSPLFIIASLLVWLSMGGPLVFRQQRPGRFGRPFMLFKFRTMSERRDTSGNLLDDAVRLTRVGRLLRATSLDELPQLWNVFRGDMSLVGPRPLLMNYLARYLPEQARRHDVMPGITGWAQINGRNSIGWEEKLSMDTWYVDHWSLWLDLKILTMTVLRVVRREGISNQDYATMPEFMGLSAITDGRSERHADAHRR
jgi:lipopolysaccharide/colanic/teichoic acid biosynthesis glycosyltransferase/glycosyltransferase involved in cell wall biosynthesis